MVNTQWAKPIIVLLVNWHTLNMVHCMVVSGCVVEHVVIHTCASSRMPHLFSMLYIR